MKNPAAIYLITAARKGSIECHVFNFTYSAEDAEKEVIRRNDNRTRAQRENFITFSYRKVTQI